MKFALISNVLPPSRTAHAAIIHRLLSELDPESYCLLSSRDYRNRSGPDYAGRLKGRYYYLPPYHLPFGYRFLGGRAREQANLLLGVALRAWHIARIVKREACEAVVVCTGGNEIIDFPAGYLASRLTGARFYAYLLDQYAHMVSYVLGNSFLRHFEPMVIKGAAAVIATNEFLRDDVNRRYGVEAALIHNACDLSAYEAEAKGGPDESGEIRIVYTGGVGPLHYDALRNLVTAIGSLGREDMRLHLYTAQSRTEIEENEIRGPVVFHEHEPISAMPAVQQQAHILFLPLAFDSPFPDIVRTAAPGKLGEYLAARRPVLVHAPADSFVAWYFRRHECGLVVDRPDPAELASGLDLLLSDRALRERLRARAWERAREDFGMPKARAQFAGLLHLNPSNPR